MITAVSFEKARKTRVSINKSYKTARQMSIYRLAANEKRMFPDNRRARVHYPVDSAIHLAIGEKFAEISLHALGALV